MNRRDFLKAAAYGALAGTGCRFATWGRSERRANLVVFMADDMRWDAMGAGGNRIVQTPALDALAADGVVFANNFVTTSICPTSRTSILTGLYARRHGIWDFDTPIDADRFRDAYPALLRAAGYRTAFLGKWGIGGALPEKEFDVFEGYSGQGHYFDPRGERQQHLEAFLGDRALAFLGTLREGESFCLALSSKAPHAQDGDPEPFQPDPRFAELYRDVTIPRPASATAAHFDRLPAFLRNSEGRERWKRRFSTDERFQHSVKQYYRLISGVDDLVGRVVQRLKELGLYDVTVFVFTADNGFLLGEHGLAGKWWGYEESIRTPLIIKPAERARGLHVHAMTLNIDLAPTLLELAGVDVPASMQGSSLVQFVRGERRPIREDWLYEHLLEHDAIAKSEGVRGERYKYLRYVDRDADGEFLFDLQRDPFEETNLAASPQHLPHLSKLRARLDELRRELA